MGIILFNLSIGCVITFKNFRCFRPLMGIILFNLELAQEYNLEEDCFRPLMGII